MRQTMHQTMSITKNRTMKRTMNHEPWTINQGLTLSTIRSSLVISDGHFGSLHFIPAAYSKMNEKYLSCPRFYEHHKKWLKIALVGTNHSVLIVGYVLTILEGSEDIILWLYPSWWGSVWVRGVFTLCLFNLHPLISTKRSDNIEKRINHATIFSRFHEFYHDFSVHFSFAQSLCSDNECWIVWALHVVMTSPATHHTW